MLNPSYETLEFPKIVRALSGLSFSEAGKEACLHLEPVTNIHELEELQQETEDALTLLRERGDLPLNGLETITTQVERASRGSALNLSELRRIGVFLRTIDRLQSWSLTQLDDAVDQTEEESLKDNRVIQKIHRFIGEPELGYELERVIISDDEMSDQASPQLASIRQAKDHAARSVREALQDILRRKPDALQDNLITQRDGRYVVPVKAERRQEVPGILHDSSGSGQTIFIEPMAVVQANNKIRMLEREEEEEIERILWAYSERVGELSTQLLHDAALATDLDVIWAKAKLANEMKATRPKLNEEGIIDLKQARHPLIPKDEVVPIDIYVGDDFKTLVITGPNTGGKTVALKTVGLLTLMGMCGLHLPAAKGSIISTFEHVFADIGDDQSIEQSLSTFSSHMTRMVKIIDNVNERSLVLSDELGSGTDPAEGAALAVAILDYLRHHGAVTIATTHYKELKLYALGTDNVENAACEFDVETLKPTYRIQIGVPGVSNAFVISKKLGLNDEILEMAQAQMTEEGIAFERVVTEIEEQRHETERLLEQERQIRNQAARERRELRKMRANLAKEKEKIIQEAREEGRAAWDEQIEALDEMVRELRHEMDQGNYNAKDTIRDVEALRREAHEGRKELHKQAKKQVPQTSEDELKIGKFYKAQGSGLKGKLVELDEDSNEALLAIGNLQMRVPLGDLKATQAPPMRASQQSKPRKRRRSGAQTVRSELNLIGQRALEAEHNLDQYLDQATLAGLEQVRIVHGKGSGALRKMTHQFLKNDRRVADFELAAYGEGDAGVTIAYLK